MLLKNDTRQRQKGRLSAGDITGVWVHKLLLFFLLVIPFVSRLIFPAG